MVTTEDFLEHHGIKGQKWGRRNIKRVSNPSEDHKAIIDIRKKKVSELSNQQLRFHNERLTLTTKFNQMNPTKIQHGKAKATAILATLGVGATAYNMATSNAGKAAIATAKKILRGKGKHFIK